MGAILPMERASTTGITNKISSVISKKKRDKSKKKKSRKRSKSKNKKKKRKREKKKLKKKKKIHDRTTTDIGIFEYKKRKNGVILEKQKNCNMNGKKRKESTKIRGYDKRQSFHKRKSRTVDFSMSSHRPSLKEIVRHSLSETDDDEEDDDKIVLPQLKAVQSAGIPTNRDNGQYTFRLHI